MNHYERSSLNHFTSWMVDRVSHRRTDGQWLAARLQDENTRFVPVWRSKNLFAAGQVAEPILLPPADVQDLARTAEPAILLGVNGDRTYFAIDVPSEGELPPADLSVLGEFRDLRRVALLLNEKDGGLLAYAKAIAAARQRAAKVVTCGCARTTRAGSITFQGSIRRSSCSSRRESAACWDGNQSGHPNGTRRSPDL